MKGINIMFSKEIQLMNMEVRLGKLSQFPVENKNIINKLKRRIANLRAGDYRDVVQFGQNA